jgi:classical protein kinase C
VDTCCRLVGRTSRNVQVRAFSCNSRLTRSNPIVIECDLTCHATCAHLVPYFCGMTMANASALINSMRDIRSHQQHRPRPQTHQTQPSFSHQTSGSQSGITYEPERQPTSPTAQIEQGMGGINLGRPQDDYGQGPTQPPKSSPYPPSNQPLYGPGVTQVPLPGSPGPAKRTSGPGYDPHGAPPNAYGVSNFTSIHEPTSNAIFVATCPAPE